MSAMLLLVIVNCSTGAAVKNDYCLTYKFVTYEPELLEKIVVMNPNARVVLRTLATNNSVYIELCKPKEEKDGQ